MDVIFRNKGTIEQTCMFYYSGIWEHETGSIFHSTPVAPSQLNDNGAKGIRVRNINQITPLPSHKGALGPSALA